MPQTEGGETRLGSLPPGAYIAAVISDFSREFGDTAHEAANITQAWRLWRAVAAPAALDEPAFVQQVLYPARARTRQAQGAQGPRLIENKMAYLFQILRDLVARYGREPSPDPVRPPPDSAGPDDAKEAYGSIDC